MSAQDRHSFVYIDRNGREYRPVKNSEIPEDWAVSYHTEDNDGYTFMRRGPESRICIEINRYANPIEIRKAIEILKGTKGREQKERKIIASELERMLYEGLKKIISKIELDDK